MNTCNNEVTTLLLSQSVELLLWLTVEKIHACTTSDSLPGGPMNTHNNNEASHKCGQGQATHLKVVALVHREEEEGPPRTIEGRVERHNIEPTGVPLVLDSTNLAAEADCTDGGGGGYIKGWDDEDGERYSNLSPLDKRQISAPTEVGGH